MSNELIVKRWSVIGWSVPKLAAGDAMTRRRHSRKEIEATLAYAEAQGWRVKPVSGHAWGWLYCSHNDSECRCGEFCIVSVWSTSKNAVNHARQLRRVVDNCTGGSPSEEDET